MPAYIFPQMSLIWNNALTQIRLPKVVGSWG